MPEFCKVERDGHVTTITINRPEVMNAIHPPASPSCHTRSTRSSPIPTPGGDPHRRGREGVQRGQRPQVPGGGQQDRMARHRLRGLTQRFENAKPVIAR